MKNIELRKYLTEVCGEQAIIFDNPEFDSAIIGTCGSRIVYDYDKMVKSLSEDLVIEPIEAVDYIDYNSLRSLPYQNQEFAPIVIETLPEEVVSKWSYYLRIL